MVVLGNVVIKNVKVNCIVFNGKKVKVYGVLDIVIIDEFIIFL